MDAELPARLAVDLPGGFDALVRSFQHRIFAFALGLSGDPADAEEVAQDAFLRAYRALLTYDAERIRGLALSAWLHRIALNVFRNRVRRRMLRVMPLDGELKIADRRAGPEEQALRSAALLELASLVAGLPELQRAAVVLRCVQDLPYAEVAQVLGQPKGTVKSNVHRGLAALRARLALSEVS
jgi:RNA polymerase sigma-70 factor (ECF subfamily)